MGINKPQNDMVVKENFRKSCDFLSFLVINSASTLFTVGPSSDKTPYV